MAQVRQSRPDSGRGFQANVLKTFQLVPSSLGSGSRETFGHWRPTDPASHHGSTNAPRGCSSLCFLTAVQRALPNEIKAESGTSQRKSGTSHNLSKSENSPLKTLRFQREFLIDHPLV